LSSRPWKEDSPPGERLISIALDIKRVSKQFEGVNGETVTVLQDLSLSTTAGEFICILGASGSGKTTLLNIISGLEEYTGQVIFRDRDKSLLPSEVKLGRVFQEPRLLPWANVYENIKLVLPDNSRQEDLVKHKIEEYLGLVGLWDFKDYYPNQLSGGMQQRVALARAFAIEPGLLVMDEPFNSLDESMAQKLSSDLLRLWKYHGKTIIYVTHNILEALFLGDRLLFIDGSTGTFSKEWDNPLPRPRNYYDPDLYQLYLQLREEMDSEQH